MTPQERSLVQESFAAVRPISDQAAAMFYERLFTIAPEVKPLFKGDMSEQGKKLMQMLAVAVNGLNNLEAILPAVQELGRKHVDYGVTAAHYQPVGERCSGRWNKALAMPSPRRRKRPGRKPMPFSPAP